MLLEFRFKNFKTFKEETVFSMTPAPKIKDLEYSVLESQIGKKIYKTLPTAVIYGPNASGKTNIISAIEVFKSIVLRGNIENGDFVFDSSNEATKTLELIPNLSSDKPQPVEFEIKFIENNTLYQYGIKIDLGVFLEKEYNRQILGESLYINNEMIFERNASLSIGDLSTIFNELVVAFEKSASDKMAQNNLNKKELFLTGLFKSLYSSKITNDITEWFRNKCKVFLRANMMVISPRGKIIDTKQAYNDLALNKALNRFGVLSNEIIFLRTDDNKRLKPHSVLPNNIAFPVEIFESYGTERFVNLFPIICNVLRNGSTLIIDEFDASLHPMALMSIIGAFHNDEINKKGAQLIFNTQNPIFLNKNLFRRDEIKFVDRDDDTGISSHYSLSDFGTSGPNGVRNTEDYMKNYFISRYGSIRDIDFSDIFKEQMENDEDETD